MADTDVPKVPASGLTGSAPVAKKSVSTASKTTSSTASKATAALNAKNPQTKQPSSTVKPGLTKAGSKTSLLNPSINPNQKSLSTSKTNLEIKQNSSSVDSSNSKKTEQQRSSASLNSLTSKSDSKLIIGKLNKSTPSLDSLKGSEASVELKKSSKSSEPNKVSSSTAVVDSKTAKLDSKDSKPAQKGGAAASKKVANAKAIEASSIMEDSNLAVMSEINITSTVSDDDLGYQSVTDSSQDKVGESAAKLSIESASSNESFEVISISDAKSERTSPLLKEEIVSVDPKSNNGENSDLKKEETLKTKVSDSKKDVDLKTKESNSKKDVDLKNKEGDSKKDVDLKNKEGDSKKDEKLKTIEGDFRKDDDLKNKEVDLKKNESLKNKEADSKKDKIQVKKEVFKKDDDAQNAPAKDREVDSKIDTTTSKKGLGMKTDDEIKVENKKSTATKNEVKAKGVDTNKCDTQKDSVKEVKVDLKRDQKIVTIENDGSKNVVVKDSLNLLASSDGSKNEICDSGKQSADGNKKVANAEDEGEKNAANGIKQALFDLLDTDKQVGIVLPSAQKMSSQSETIKSVHSSTGDDDAHTATARSQVAASVPSHNLSVCPAKGPENERSKSDMSTTPNANSQTPATNAAAGGSSTAVSNMESKHAIRMQVWNSLDANKLVKFPRPCRGRIPHFVGSPEAADKLAELDVFKNAKSVQVNPDKPQSYIRYHTLKAGKQLLVPNPMKTSGFLLKAEADPENAADKDLMYHATQQGIRQIGKPVELKDNIKVDLVVIGAVAVSKEGYVIGRGQGYADLEYALMMSQGIITKDTVVACTVHDDQVFDTLPKHLFASHDVPVDLIVTPTQVIEVTNNLEKPTGIIWNKVSNRRISKIPVLTMIRDEEVKENKDCTLKEEDSDLEDESNVRPYFRRYNRYNSGGGGGRQSYGGGRGRRGRGRGRGGRGGGGGRGGPRGGVRGGGEDMGRVEGLNNSESNRAPRRGGRRGRTFSRNSQQQQQQQQQDGPVTANNNNNNNNMRSASRNLRKGGRNANNASSEEKAAGGDASRPMPQQQRHRNPRLIGRKPPMPIEFVMKVSGLTRGMRVRDLKAALSERQVKPYDITWLASDGQAYLLFAKDLKHSKPNIVTELSPVNVVEGFPAKLEMKIEGPPRRHKMDWTVNGKTLDTNKGGRIKVATKADGTVRLLIDRVEPDDSGEYAVTIKNSNGEVTSKAAVIVADKKKPDRPEVAPQFVGELEEVALEERSCLSLAAPIAGNPTPEVEWTKDDLLLSPNDRMQFSCDGSKVSLELNLCRVIDSGVYKCKLTNSLGSAESSARVTISRPKKRQPNLPQAAINPDSLDMINIMMDKMRDLKIKSEGEDAAQSLSVELASPVSRIESIQVSAV